MIEKNGDTPLCLAIRKRNIYIIAELLKNGADPNLHSKIPDSSPLNIALDTFQYNIVEMLLQHGADPNTLSYSRNTRDMISPMHNAVLIGNLQICLELSAHGGKLRESCKNIKTKFSKSILVLLAENDKKIQNILALYNISYDLARVVSGYIN
jgi:ankyrin repeat protein